MGFLFTYRGENMDLYEWTKHYIKFRDCMKKNIKELVLEEGIIQTKEKKEDKTYIVSEDIEHSIEKIRDNITTILVCLNTKNNIKHIYQHWDVLSKNTNLTIICAQPNTNESWSVHPNTHHKISENIKEGLQTLYESISSSD